MVVRVGGVAQSVRGQAARSPRRNALAKELDARAVTALVARAIPWDATNKAMILRNAIEIHDYFLGKGSTDFCTSTRIKPVAKLILMEDTPGDARCVAAALSRWDNEGGAVRDGLPT
jgi:hypothetical protein